ncbi:btk-binding protein-related [Anaeramoeba flamelloides]|uniref:Btk-binding protein-related n=1 Tax=Anaeramoeba flamelloides TaxID=1746091 RepID=A0AAV7YYR7_9EUKA|nr:btk-binding protein-related [Anaeramoeba flamelloides]
MTYTQKIIQINGSKIDNSRTFDHNVVEVSCGNKYQTFLLQNGELYEYRNNNKKLVFKNAKTARSGYDHYLLLDTENNLWVKGCMGENYGQIGNGKDIKAESLTRQIFFQKNQDLTLQSIHVTSYCSFFLTTDMVLYGCGHNPDSRLTTKSSGNVFTPLILVEGKVEELFTDTFSQYYCYKMPDQSYYAVGSAVVNQKKVRLDTLEEFKGKQIQLIGCSYSNIMVLLAPHDQQGTQELWYLHNQPKPKKLDINFLTSPITSISSGNYNHMFRTLDNSVYNIATNTISQTKIDLPTIDQDKIWHLSCSDHQSIVFEGYPHFESTVAEDLSYLLKNQLFVDFELFEDIKVHRMWFEHRLARIKIEKIKSIIQEWPKKEIQQLVTWVYNDQYSAKIITKLANELSIEIPVCSIRDSLLQLWKDEEGKNFNILVSDDVIEEEDDDNNDEENDQEQIPVHRFILILRSGLFREMFTNIQEKTNSVKDYSGKTPETLEVFIKFLYTDKIELTADDDPILIYEELENCQEYYQLPYNSTLKGQLHKLAKDYDLK